MRESDLLAALGTPHCGLAVTLDCGEAHNIHPQNKRPMGERLALLARAIAYDEKLEAWGPIYRSLTVRDSQAVLAFDHVGAGLELRGDGGWEVCGADGKYVPAQARVEGDQVVVWSTAVATPAAVRYAWATVPRFSLYNREKLLASPFRTRLEPPE
jgi:sialate O-acetylesterase